MSGRTLLEFANDGKRIETAGFYSVEGIDDINRILYFSSSSVPNLIYLNKDNKVVLYHAEKGSRLVDYNLASIEEIYNFVSY